MHTSWGNRANNLLFLQSDYKNEVNTWAQQTGQRVDYIMFPSGPLNQQIWQATLTGECNPPTSHGISYLENPVNQVACTIGTGYTIKEAQEAAAYYYLVLLNRA